MRQDTYILYRSFVGKEERGARNEIYYGCNGSKHAKLVLSIDRKEGTGVIVGEMVMGRCDKSCERMGRMGFVLSE